MANEINSIPNSLTMSQEGRSEGLGTRRVQQVFRWVVRSVLLMSALSTG